MAKVDTYPAWTKSGVKVTSQVGSGVPAGVQFLWPDGRKVFTVTPQHGLSLDACDDVNGEPVAIIVGQDPHNQNHAFLVRPGSWEILGVTNGIRAVAINVVNGALRWLYVQSDGRHYTDTGTQKELPADQLGTSQGILALEDDGRINWAAPPDRREPAAGVLLYHKVNAGELSAGLLAEQDQCVLCDTAPHTLATGLVHNIRITKFTDGNYGVCGRLDNGLAFYQAGPPWPDFVQPSDPLPDLERVPLLNRTFGLACYTFNNFTSRGNLKIPIRPDHIGIETQTIATTDDVDRVGDLDLFAVYSGESSTMPAETSVQLARQVGTARERGLFIYQDSFPMRETVLNAARVEDVLTPQLYRNAGETTDAFKTRMRDEYARGAHWNECWPTVNIHQRYSGTTPTLSVREVCEGFVAACELAEEQQWPGMVLFRVGTSDVPDEIWPYVDRFVSGITGVPDARVIAEPQEPDEPDPIEPEEPVMADRVYIEDPTAPQNKAIRMLNKPLKEIAHGDEVALQLEDGKYLSVIPDGTFTFDATGVGAYQLFKIAKNNPSQYLVPRHDRIYRFGRLVEA